jgi:hypothetical protein
MFDPKLPTFYHKNANNQFSHVHNLVFLQFNGIFRSIISSIYISITILCKCVCHILLSFDSEGRGGKDIELILRDCNHFFSLIQLIEY